MSEENQIHPAGTFDGTLKKVVVGEASTGTKFIGLAYETSHGVARIQLWMTEKARDNTLKALGQNLGWVPTQGVAALLAKSGSIARIKVEHETYNGQLRDRCQFAGETQVYEGSQAEKALADFFDQAKPETSAGDTTKDSDFPF